MEAVDSAKPDHHVVADSSIRDLLERFKPRVSVNPSSYRPMSFYGDYLPRTELQHDTRGLVERSPSRQQLKSVARQSGFYLDYRVPSHRIRGRSEEKNSPTYYGRVYVDSVPVDSEPKRLLFLKYSTVFPYSGLPWKIHSAKWFGSKLAGNPYAWHELDIHGAVYVIVDPDHCVPLGIVLAQHNYHRTLWRNVDFTWPGSTHVTIGYATNSNEPYLLSPERRTRTVRTVGNPENLAWLYGRQSRPLLDAGYDQILAPEDGAVTVPMDLKILPEGNPLYTASIALGDRRKLFNYWSHWTREGPPGINYYAPPRLVDVSDLTAFHDLDGTDDTFWRKFKRSEHSLLKFPGISLLNHQRKKMSRVLKRLKKLESPAGSGCVAALK